MKLHTETLHIFKERSAIVGNARAKAPVLGRDMMFELRTFEFMVFSQRVSRNGPVGQSRGIEVNFLVTEQSLDIGDLSGVMNGIERRSRHHPAVG